MAPLQGLVFIACLISIIYIAGIVVSLSVMALDWAFSKRSRE